MIYILQDSGPSSLDALNFLEGEKSIENGMTEQLFAVITIGSMHALDKYIHFVFKQSFIIIHSIFLPNNCSVFKDSCAIFELKAFDFDIAYWKENYQ